MRVAAIVISTAAAVSLLTGAALLGGRALGIVPVTPVLAGWFAIGIFVVGMTAGNVDSVGADSRGTVCACTEGVTHSEALHK